MTCGCERIRFGIHADGACFSSDRAHRYLLWRTWHHARPLLGAVMLNPSIADETVLDPTLRRVRGYAERDGYGGMIIGNAFAHVSTKPKGLVHLMQRVGVAAAVGPENDDHLRILVERCDLVLVGWGAHLEYPKWGNERPLALRGIIGAKAHRLGQTAGGQPKHPLYLKADAPFVPHWQ